MVRCIGGEAEDLRERESGKDAQQGEEQAWGAEAEDLREC